MNCSWSRPVPILNALKPVLERLTEDRESDERLLRGPRGGVLTTASVRDATRILPVRFLYTKGQLGPINDLELYRSILRLRGMASGHSRAPLLPLTDTQNTRLQELLTEQGLL